MTYINIIFHAMRERHYNDPIFKKKNEFVDSEEGPIPYYDHVLKLQKDGALAINFSTEGNDSSYTTDREDYIRTEYTRATPLRFGPLFEVVYFKIAKTFEEVRYQLTDIYSYPINLDGLPFEDLAFYKNEKTKIAICSHEHSCYLDLSEEEIEEFIQLGIEYEII